MHKHRQPHWRRSSYSDSSNGSECVEVATAPGTVQVRDSKNLPGPRLGFAPTAWNAFLAHTSGR
ncbi:MULTISPECIES: DUF397 domain-containing protein [Streptomyces]|uniref:DUF397 domain-containing protein n=1 Tax=Streptomyces flavovirens TaxID=52258 RepID=A0ABV8N7E6_9ACTN|nr:DUF397 domain-containing protein [Streptomyces sp. MBT51]MBK3590930.1 DUF397 domain-containing protein [Streptomyces sp. MBT51]